MGHSITCNFQVHIEGTGKRGQAQYGAMTLKDIKGLIKSENNYLSKDGQQVVKAIVWSQTKSGEKYLKGHDFMIMTPDEKITYHNITDEI
jgi:hypothetical protein